MILFYKRLLGNTVVTVGILFRSKRYFLFETLLYRRRAFTAPVLLPAHIIKHWLCMQGILLFECARMFLLLRKYKGGPKIGTIFVRLTWFDL